MAACECVEPLPRRIEQGGGRATLARAARSLEIGGESARARRTRHAKSAPVTTMSSSHPSRPGPRPISESAAAPVAAAHSSVRSAAASRAAS
jgi:hypothetical protein